jgi:ABC-2 type transport system permease protein
MNGGTGFLRLVGVVARRDYLRTVRRRGYVFGTLLLPIGLGALFFITSLFATSGLTDGPSPRDVTLIVVNESSVRLAIDPALRRNVASTTRAAAEEALASGGAGEYYLMPARYPGDPTVVRVDAERRGLGVESAQRHELQAQLLAAVLRDSFLSGVTLDAATQARILSPFVLRIETPSGTEVSDLAMAASFLVPFAFTLLFVMSIFITSGYLLQSVTEEKENRVVEIVLSSIPSLPLMAGKVLGLGAAGLTQVAVWLITAVVAIPLISDRLGGLGDIQLSPAVVVLGVVYFVLGYLAYGAIFAAIGALAPGNREAQQYSGFFGFVAVIPLIFAAAIISDPTSLLVWALALFPLTAPAAMLQVLTLAESVPVAMVVLSLISLTVFVVVATIASARVFRATLLLYGVRPSIRQLMDAVLAR